MTIEEAIAHCYDVANGKDSQCDECRQEHLQLAKWLEELRTLRKEKFHKGGDFIPAEKTFENKIKKFLESEGAYFVKFFANSYTKSGVPDILACVNGYFVGVEVKAQNGKPSELQLYNVGKIREAGGFAMVLYPSAFQKFKDFVKGLKEERYTHDAERIWK